MTTDQIMNFIVIYTKAIYLPVAPCNFSSLFYINFLRVFYLQEHKISFLTAEKKLISKLNLSN